MKLNKTMRVFIECCAFAQREQLQPQDVAELITLAQKCHAAGERLCCGTISITEHDRVIERFDSKASALGYKVEWPGLWPVLRKGDRDVYIPTGE